MVNSRVGSIEQIKSAFEVQFTSGKASGKNCILVHNGDLEVLFSKDNALDILYVKYKGKNISFLSANNINTKSYGFSDRFEGGFLYTCGLDNMGLCVKDKVQHGSLHLTKAENVVIDYKDNDIIISGTVRNTALFYQNTAIHRSFTVSENSISIMDTVINESFSKSGHCILYHVNYGHPFLSEDMTLDIPSSQIDPCNDFAKEGLSECLKMSAPIDAIPERCYYHHVTTPKITLTNPKINAKICMEYDKNTLPTLVQWKSMASGAYALGIEPASTRFDNFNLVELDKGESTKYSIKITFSEI